MELLSVFGAVGSLGSILNAINQPNILVSVCVVNWTKKQKQNCPRRLWSTEYYLGIYHYELAIPTNPQTLFIQIWPFLASKNQDAEGNNRKIEAFKQK